MADIKMKLKDALQSQLLFLGGSNGRQTFGGFINEKINEGTKRRARKIVKILSEEAEDFQNTQKALMASYGFDKLNEEERIELQLTKDEKFLEYSAEVEALLEEVILLSGVERISFSVIEDKVFESTLDFELLYEYFFE